MFSNTLIIFTRFPVAGKVKTRLIPVLGEEGAAKFQKEMTEKIVETARKLRERSRVKIEIHYAGGSESKFKDWLGDDFIYREQSRGDIGKKMNESLNTVLKKAPEKAILIGTDCPAITVKILQNAFDGLSENDFVLGPARDGGYYLVGLKKECPQIFQNVRWGSSEVLQETIKKIEEINLSYALVEKLDDIDRPEDVKLFYNERDKDR